MDIYRNVFKKKYEENQAKFSISGSLKADFLSENEYPIESYNHEDKNNEKQYYRAILHKPNFTSHSKVTEWIKKGEFAFVEGYSTN